MAIFLWRGIFCSTFEDTDIVVSAGSYDADYVQGRSRASCSRRTEGAVLGVLVARGASCSKGSKGFNGFTRQGRLFHRYAVSKFYAHLKVLF